MRRPYPMRLLINGFRVSTVVIDSHYERKHSSTVNDNVIIEIVKTLNGMDFLPDRTDGEGFEYFATGPHLYSGKPFRLVWLLPPDKSFIGVINCYRRAGV